ncbi:hypothetical protein LWC33_16155 [Pseudonocardia sp. RS11V-5]|uniref:hypothetical protein n=1 Tax=Pseudonocardia terrae TaxID=2905831 RepID=UPI001E2D6499|nr:hypothetical protein [Pseudonocardia terrae]MCE3552984.1 hypothetical protein [Pseudonocardia terrae]
MREGASPAAGERGQQAPRIRLAQLCRAHEVELGLVTDGRWWVLVRAPRGSVTSHVVFDAVGWGDASDRDVVRAFLSFLRRTRFFACRRPSACPRCSSAVRTARRT